jgi:hypothetical protein
MDPAFDPAWLEQGGAASIVQYQRIVAIGKGEDPPTLVWGQMAEFSRPEHYSAKLFGPSARDLDWPFAHFVK